MRRIGLYLLLSFMLSNIAFARFEWRNVVQEVSIARNGSVTVQDERTLWTDEDFGEAFICIQLSAGQRIELLEDSGAISAGPDAEAFTQACDGGTELVVRNARRIKERRVRFHYILTGSTDAFSDVIQWYWIILEQNHPGIRGYRLKVSTPGPMTAPFDAYVHRFNNPNLPTVNLSSDRQTLNVSFERIPSGSGVEIRYLMDPLLFSLRGSRPGFESLLQDEARIAGIEETQQRWRDRRSNPSLGLIALGILGFLSMGILQAFNKYGREPKVLSMKYPFEPPSDLPPAAVRAMLSQSRPDSSAMMPGFHATIMDLARRGYGEFTSKGKKFEMILDLEKSTEPLEPFEQQVLSYLKKAASQPKASGFLGLSQKNQSEEERAHLSFSELKSYSEKRLSSFINSWSKQPRIWLEAQRGGPLVSQESRRQANRWIGLALLGTFLCGGLGFLSFGQARLFFFLAAGLAFVLVFVAGASLPAWREDVAAEIYGWQGFKRTLRDYTQMKNAPDDFFKLWDRYYCYAAALGVARQFLNNLKRAAPLKGLDEQSLMRQGHWMGTRSMNDFNHFSSSINSLSSALTAASASASSGGSSSGGGGGGGGGSSGGR